MTLMTIVGTAGSGRTGILGSNAVTQSMLGRSVLILSSEHRDLEPYLRLTPNNMEYRGAGGIKLSQVDPKLSAKSILDSYLDEELPEVVIIDMPFSSKDDINDALAVHERLSKKHKHPLVCVSVQANRTGRFSSNLLV